MTTRLLVAPAAAGKTQHCIQRIRAVRIEQPLAPMWVVLPNVAQIRAFRRRLARAGGAINVRIGRFYDLYTELCEQAPAPMQLDDPTLYRILRDVIKRAHAAGELEHYASILNTPGFIRALRERIRELKQAQVQPPAFLAAVTDADSHLHEIASLYDAYQTRLRDNEWADNEGAGWLAVEALDAEPALCTDWRLLIVDGFDQFNPTQLALLRRLTERAQETLVTITGSKDGARLAHRRFLRARDDLERTLKVPAETLANETMRLATPLSHLEQHLFEPATTQAPADDAITLTTAPNRAEEVRAVLRWIKQRHVNDGILLDDLAVLARDMEKYQPLLVEVAAEFGLPLYVAQGPWLIDNPAVAAVRALLSLPARNWPRRQLLDAWRSPYFDWTAAGIEAGDAGRLEAAARYGQVISGLDQWRETLQRLTNASPSGVDEDLEDRSDSAPRGPAAADLLARFNRFVDLLQPPQHATVREYVAWVRARIGPGPTSNHAPQEKSLRIAVRAATPEDDTADRDVSALRTLTTVLHSLVVAEATIGAPSPISYTQFLDEVDGVIEATRCEPPALDPAGRVFVSSVLAARGVSFRAVALLGLAEGEFPQSPAPDPLLHDDDRTALANAGINLPAQEQGDEVTIFYEAVTRGSERLLITRPHLADDGQPWEASPYWTQLCRHLDVEPTSVHTEAGIALEDAASHPELMAAFAQSQYDMSSIELLLRDLPQLYTDWQAIRNGAEVLEARVTQEARGPYEGDLSTYLTVLDALYGPGELWSTSRLETYAQCGFMFFAAYTLGLEPREPIEAGYNVRQLGTMYHAVLEDVFRQAAETGEDPRDLLPEVARTRFNAAPDTYGFRPTVLWEQQHEELQRTLARTVDRLVEASTEWEPAYFEQAFGLGDAPPLTVYDNTGDSLRLRGVIDRIDVNSDGQLRIIDYKTGSSTISSRDLEEGKRLQLALYARAAQEVLALGEPAAGMYWHITSAEPSSLTLEAYDGGIAAAIDTATQYALVYADGARRGAFAPEPPDGGCPSWCPAADFCWRYQPRNW